MSREVKRYIENAKEILKKARKEGGYYIDMKYVKSAFGCLYLGILKAVDEFLLSKGIQEKNLPKKIDEYMRYLKKYGSVYNGKLIREFDSLYYQIHIAGYYRGFLKSEKIVKEAFEEAEIFIKKLVR